MPGQSDPAGTSAQFCSLRIWFFLLAGAVLSILLIVRSAWLVSQRNECDRMVLDELLIPGLRGSICLRNGQRLIWSERRLRLKWQLPLNVTEAMRARERLAQIPALAESLPPADGLIVLAGQQVVLLPAFPLRLLTEFSAFAESEGLFLEGYFVRCTTLSPEAACLSGKVAVDPVSGLEIGVSGLEKEYDRRLRGRVIRYTRGANNGSFTRLCNTFFSDSGNGENVLIDW